VSDVGRAARAASTADLVLAVLAFDNLVERPEMQFFSDGVSEEIIQRLRAARSSR
jgi:TolB-like protein